MFAQKAHRQELNIALTLAQRGKRYVDDIDAKIEILAELARGDQRAQVPIGCRNDAHVNVDLPCAANVPNLPLTSKPSRARA